MTFGEAWEFLKEFEPKTLNTKQGHPFKFHVQDDSIVFYPRNGEGNEKRQSLERFHYYYRNYFDEWKRDRDDFRNCEGTGSITGTFSYLLAVFELIESRVGQKKESGSEYVRLIGELAALTGCSKTELRNAWYDAEPRILLAQGLNADSIRNLTRDKPARLEWRKKSRGFEVHPREARKSAQVEFSPPLKKETYSNMEAAPVACGCRPEKGYIYILVNPAFTNYVKIGKTINDPHERAREISRGTGVPAPYSVIWDVLVSDCHKAESTVHWELRQFRARNDREFFAIPPKQAIAEVQRVCKEFECPEE